MTQFPTPWEEASRDKRLRLNLAGVLVGAASAFIPLLIGGPLCLAIAVGSFLDGSIVLGCTCLAIGLFLSLLMIVAAESAASGLPAQILLISTAWAADAKTAKRYRTMLASAVAVGAGVCTTCGVAAFYLWPGWVALALALLSLLAPSLVVGVFVVLNLPVRTSPRSWTHTDLSLPSISEEFSGHVIAHLSDLHFTGGRRTMEGARSPDEVLGRLLDTQSETVARSTAVLFTGDMTDSGAAREWRALFDTIERFPTLCNKTVFVPGNHDVNIVGRSLLSIDDGDQLERKRRLVRFMCGLWRSQGARSWILHSQGAVRVDEFLRPHSDAFWRFLKAPPQRTYVDDVENGTTDEFGNWSKKDVTPDDVLEDILRPTQLWEELFPMAVALPGLWVVVLDSNRPASTLLDNALGEIPEEALRKVGDLLAALQPLPVVYAWHHHVHLPISRGALLDAKAKAMLMTNAEQVLETLKGRDPAVVFHGHRHIRYVLEYESVQVVAAPSSTMGDNWKRDATPGFGTYAIDTASGTKLVGANWHSLGGDTGRTRASRMTRLVSVLMRLSSRLRLGRDSATIEGPESPD